MKKFQRIALLTTLVAFIGLSALEAFHCHKAHETAATCGICQIAHKAPALIGAAKAPQPALVCTRKFIPEIPHAALVFVAVAHGLSPPPVL